MSSLEQRILACSAEVNPDSCQQQRMRHLLSQEIDMDRLITVAVKEGLAGLLYKNLLRSDLLEILDLKHRKRLKSLYYQTVLFNLKLINDLKEILPLLNQEKIRVVLMQGIALLPQIYEDIGLRPMTDIDLWVLQKHYSGLINMLKKKAFHRDPSYPNSFKRGSTIIELHTHILWADRIRARKLLLAKSQEHIYGDTRIMHFDGHEALCLNPSDQVIYLSLHALKHNVSRLMWLVDIKFLLSNWKESDWVAFVDRARELGQEKTVSYIFFLLLHLFDFQLPLEARRLMERNRFNFLEKKALRDRIKKDSLPVWSPLVCFPTGKGLKRRFSFILETLFPRPDVLKQIFADSADQKVWKLYIKRALQLLGMIKMP
jgi:hypothetical protein